MIRPRPVPKAWWPRYRQRVRRGGWLLAGLLLLAIGLWPWWDTPSWFAWQRLAVPWLGPPDPRLPLWARCDSYIHFWVSLGIGAWLAAGLRAVGLPQVLALVLVMLIGSSDELLQSLGRRGFDATDLAADLAAVSVLGVVLLGQGALSRRRTSPTAPGP